MANLTFLPFHFRDVLIAHKMDWTSYHRLDDIYGYLTYLAMVYPNLVNLINIGTSYENRTLYVVRISNATAPDTQPAVWIDGGIALAK